MSIGSEENFLTTISGTSLASLGYEMAGVIQVGTPAPFTSYVDVPGMSGSFDATLRNPLDEAYYGRRQISLPVVTSGFRSTVADAKAKLGKYVGKRVRLYDYRNEGYWRGTMSLDQWSDYQEFGSGVFVSKTNILIDAEPFLLYDVVSVSTGSITPGSHVSVYIAGNKPTWPTITLTPTGNSRTIGIECVAETGAPLGNVSHTASSNITATVTIDCYMSTMIANNSRLAVSLDAVFPIVAPGYMTVVLTGATNATFTYEPKVML